MQLNDVITVEIEKVVNLGFGLAHYNGAVVFIKNSCTGDIVSARVVNITKSYAHAEIIDIIRPSHYRVTPFCKYQNICGSCQLQHIDYTYQLRIKHDIVQDALNEFGVEIKPVIPSPRNQHCRSKMQFSVEPTSNNQILVGYYQNMTHKVIDIDSCKMQPKSCDQIINFIRNEAHNHGISGYSESTGKGDLRHILIRSSEATKQNLVVLIVNAHHINPKMGAFCKAIFDNCSDICGVCVNFNEEKNNTILGDITKCVCGQNFVFEKICDVKFKIGPKTFFQVNPSSAQNIFKFVKSYISEHIKNAVVLDAYAGISAFGLVLSRICNKVVSVEENKEAVDLAREVCELNGVKNITLYNMDAEKFLANEVACGNKYDVIVIDPPRKGCTQNSLDYALKLSKSYIIYVSCNPSTLARDLRYLTQNGMDIKLVQPFDLFCHTYHVETVVLLSKNKKI